MARWLKTLQNIFLSQFSFIKIVYITFNQTYLYQIKVYLLHFSEQFILPVSYYPLDHCKILIYGIVFSVGIT